MSDVDAGVDAVCKQLTEGFNTKDLDKIIECYTKDIIFITAEGLLKGHDATRKAWAGFLEKYDTLDFKYTDRRHSGDMCTDAGDVSLTGKEGKLVGWYCSTFVKEADGKWRFRFDNTFV